ncbi:hypothetical protein KRP22_014896 [Phytophthora ramorum]|nr:hypothetical protein KRP22_14049 [Phytophthora ramorum]
MSLISVWMAAISTAKETQKLMKSKELAALHETKANGQLSNGELPKDNYSQNFVAFCKTNNDCTIGGIFGRTDLITGTCVDSRCSCSYPESWVGPRCTVALAESSSSKASTRVYGPPIVLPLGLAGVVVFLTFLSVFAGMKSAAKKNAAIVKATMMAKSDAVARGADTGNYVSHAS